MKLREQDGGAAAEGGMVRRLEMLTGEGAAARSGMTLGGGGRQFGTLRIGGVWQFETRRAIIAWGRVGRLETLGRQRDGVRSGITLGVAAGSF